MIDSLIEEKLDEMVDLIDNNTKIIRMRKLKSIIYNDSELKKMLDDYHSSKSIEIKKNIIENELIKEYRELENELYFTILEVNKRLNKLTGKKVCKIESN